MRGKKLGRRALTRVAGIVTPDTILRWYRQLIAKKYDGSALKRPGPPMAPREITELVVRMALENPKWGYTRLRDRERIHQGLRNRLLQRAHPCLKNGTLSDHRRLH